MTVLIYGLNSRLMERLLRTVCAVGNVVRINTFCWSEWSNFGNLKSRLATTKIQIFFFEITAQDLIRVDQR